MVVFFKSKFRASFQAVQRRGLAIIQRIAKAPPHYRDSKIIKKVDPSEYLDARGARAQLYQMPRKEAMGDTDGSLQDVTLLGSAIYTSINATCRHRFLAIQQRPTTAQEYAAHEGYLEQLVSQSIQKQTKMACADSGSTWGELLRMPLAIRPSFAQGEEA